MTFNETWMSKQQAEHIAGLARSVIGRGIFVEIGCWEGFSTYHIAQAIDPELLCCVDTWRGNEDENMAHPSVTAAKERNVYQTFCDNMDQLTTGNYIPYRMDWRAALSVLARPIAFLHIDASHDYTSVKETIDMWYPWVVHGGIICGDDFKTANATRDDLHGGVERAVRDCFDNQFESNYNAWWKHKL